MSDFLGRIAASPLFQNFITLTICLAGILVGVETDATLAHEWHWLLAPLDKIVLAIFVLEIVVKMGAEGSKPWRYFRDPWNVFDFTIVAVAFVPGAAQYAVVLRLARLLRVLKLVRAVPKLQLIVSALLKSIPSMFYVTTLLLLLFYVYGVAGVFLFGPNDPTYFGSLGISLLSLFRIVTLEGWTELLYIQFYGCASYGYEDASALCTHSVAQPLLAVVYFISFVLLGTMIILNLFVGVIMNGMEEAHREAVEESRGQKGLDVDNGLAELAAELDSLSNRVSDLRSRLSSPQKPRT